MKKEFIMIAFVTMLMFLSGGIVSAKRRYSRKIGSVCNN